MSQKILLLITKLVFCIMCTCRIQGLKKLGEYLLHINNNCSKTNGYDTDRDVNSLIYEAIDNVIEMEKLELGSELASLRANDISFQVVLLHLYTHNSAKSRNKKTKKRFIN